MSEAVVYEQFDQAPAGGTQDTEGGSSDLRRLSDVPLELSVEIGRTRMTVNETLQLRAGSIVTLERLAGEPVDLLVNGTPIARGEVVIVDEQFGLRVTEIVEGDPAAPGLGAQLLAGAAAPAPPDLTRADPPAPVDSAPVDPAPPDPALIDSAPVDSAPTDPAVHE